MDCWREILIILQNFEADYPILGKQKLSHKKNSQTKQFLEERSMPNVIYVLDIEFERRASTWRPLRFPDITWIKNLTQDKTWWTSDYHPVVEIPSEFSALSLLPNWPRTFDRRLTNEFEGFVALESSFQNTI